MGGISKGYGQSDKGFLGLMVDVGFWGQWLGGVDLVNDNKEICEVLINRKG